MSERKEPRPVAWQVGEWLYEASGGRVCALKADGDGGSAGGCCAPDVAESRALALIMAAAVARGEQGHTAALNRVAAALDAPAARPAVADVDAMVQQMRDALHMAGDTPWGLLVSAASRLRGELDDLRVGLSQRIERLVRARLAVGAVAGESIPDAAVRLRSMAEAYRQALNAINRHLGEPVAELVTLPPHVAAVVEGRGRLRAELGEARAALDGKTMRDAAAEVVAPLREALGCDTSGMTPAGVVEAAAVIVREALDATPLPSATREPMAHASLTSIEEHGVVVGDRILWVGWHESGRMVDAVRASHAVEGICGARWVGRGAGNYNQFPLTVVEAPDAAH